MLAADYLSQHGLVTVLVVLGILCALIYIVKRP